jgi:hypothetical protein
VSASETCEALYGRIVAPLVLGGALRPMHALGVRDAAVFDWHHPLDKALATRVESARRRCARALVAVDWQPSLTAADWALAAGLNNVLLALHPGFAGAWRGRSARAILAAAEAIIAKVPAPARAADALARHTWLARLFEPERVETGVSGWSGSQAFLGWEPPARLSAWPSLRGVQVRKTRLSLFELTPLAIPPEDLERSLAALLSRTPLTDLATCARGRPAFAWTAPTLGLIESPVGRTLALRALAAAPSELVDAALGQATRSLLEGHQGAPPEGGTAVIAFLRERALAAIESGEPFDTGPDTYADARYSRLAGAHAARSAVSVDPAWSGVQREALLAKLDSAIARVPVSASVGQILHGLREPGAAGERE